DRRSEHIATREDDVSSRNKSVNTIDAAIICRARTTDYDVPPWIALEIPHHHRADLHADHRIAGRIRHAARDHGAPDQCECDVVAGAVSTAGGSFRGRDRAIDVSLPGSNVNRVLARREPREFEIAIPIGEDALRLIV